MYDLKAAAKQRGFIREIVYLKEERRKQLFLRESKILLIDYSVLYIKEIWISEDLTKYSYYWFTPDQKLISGWDNAPHHKELENFPFHRHQPGGASSSKVKSLPDVFTYIDQIFNLS